MQPSPNVNVQPSHNLIMEPSLKVNMQPSPDVMMEPLPKVNMPPSPRVNIQPSPRVNEEQSPDVIMESYPKLIVHPSPIITMEPSLKVNVEAAPKAPMEPSQKVNVQSSPNMLMQPSSNMNADPSRNDFSGFDASNRWNEAKLVKEIVDKDVLNVLKNNTGTEATVGLTLKLRCSSRDCFNAYAFDEMKSLRLLQLDYVQLTGGYGYLSKQLRWVSWQGFPSKYIPNNFNLDGVIAMDMKHSNLRLVWKKPQILQFLTILNLSHSKYLLETPDFSGLQSLQKLIVKDCSNLRKVHESIGDLHNLLLINMKDCTSLSNLPRELYKLKSVETLNISGCSKIDKLEEDIVQMESLTTLIAENTAVKQVPFSIVNLKSIGYISLCGYEGPSRNYFQSIIWSWMSPTMDPLSCIHSFSSTSSASLVSINMQNNDLSILAPMLSKLSNLRSIVVQCDTEFELSKQLGTILDDAYGVDFTKLEITSNTSQISKHYLKSYLIGIGCYQEVFNILSNSISEGLANSESCNVSLPGDKHPYWLAHMGEGHSVYFTVPDDCCIKGMVLCVVYLSDPEKTATECLVSVLIVNYTKCSIQICKRDTVISFNDVDWQGIISHLEPGDKVEIFVIFGHKLVVKKTAMYLMCDESIERKMVPSLKLKKNAIVRFIKKIVTSKTQ
ncbi:hypothetical protein VNO78_24246 [Psophocarpus tetragonolobus]|uniref:Uncharacterized protein n=1 Tax=Psophocarpus tetragonolobus TaxID=3891 RepID=A0AAN9XEK2_PSOTE